MNVKSYTHKEFFFYRLAWWSSPSQMFTFFCCVLLLLYNNSLFVYSSHFKLIIINVRLNVCVVLYSHGYYSILLCESYCMTKSHITVLCWVKKSLLCLLCVEILWKLSTCKFFGWGQGIGSTWCGNLYEVWNCWMLGS